MRPSSRSLDVAFPWIVAAVFAGTLLVSLSPVARGPQIFVFHHLGGWFPGPIYDEAIRPSRALWIFRASTLLYAGACGGVALLAGPGRKRTAGLAVIAACGIPAAWLSLHAERFHWKASVAGLAAELGGSQRTEDLVVIRVTANAFIQQMVRSIVGTLVKVGEGEHPPGWVAEVLEARDRAAAGPVAPPHGLFLVEVDYPEELVRG